MALERNKDISRFSAFKTPAVTEYFFDFTSRDQIPDLLRAIEHARDSQLPIVYIASGTNCLFAFDHFAGIIIHVGLKGFEFSRHGKALMLNAESGATFGPLVSESIKKFETPTLLPWVGLPGTVGGAVVGNAGCFGLDSSQIVEHVEVLDTYTGKVSSLSNPDMQYSYRSSVLKGQERYLVLSAEFNLEYLQEENPFTKVTMSEMQEIRRSKQPPGLSCGSYFTNPPNTSAGKLIDQAGLKGLCVGGMQISPHHANFFVSSVGARWQDVLEIAEIAKSKVREQFQIQLHEEVRIIT